MIIDQLIVEGRKIRIGLIEDNNLLRNNYEDFFSNDPCFELNFALNDLQFLKTLRLSKTVDVVLLDIMLPSGNSLSQLSRIKQYFPFARIVILSSLAEQDITQRAVREGANGFLLKTSSLQFIKDAIIQMFEGGFPLSPLIVNHVLKIRERNTLIESYPDLTKREIELIDILITGVPNKIAASYLNITYFTVNSHLKNIYNKLKINSKNELIALTKQY